MGAAAVAAAVAAVCCLNKNKNTDNSISFEPTNIIYTKHDSILNRIKSNLAVEDLTIEDLEKIKKELEGDNYE